MLVTRTAAKDWLHNATGRSYGWCEEQIRNLRWVQDRCREKVHSLDIERIIAEANAPVTVTPTASKLSKKKIARIQTECI